MEALLTSHGVSCRTRHPVPQKACWKCWMFLHAIFYIAVWSRHECTGWGYSNTFSPYAIAVSGWTARLSAPSNESCHRHKVGSAQQICFAIGPRYTCRLAENWVAQNTWSVLCVELGRLMWKVSSWNICCSITLCNVLQGVRYLIWVLMNGLSCRQKGLNSSPHHVF